MGDDCAELKSLLKRHNRELAELTQKLRDDKVLEGSSWPQVAVADKNPAVLKNLEPEVLDDLVLNDEVSARQEFWIAEESAKLAQYQEPDTAATYMRIHSLDSHASNLAKWAVEVSLMVSKQLSMAFVVVQLWNQSHSWHLLGAYLVLYCGALSLWVGGAAHQAHTMLTTAVGTGDYVTKKGFNLSYMKLFAVMTFLELACVPRAIAESPVTFHIRKAVQPYAVLKKDGKRVWVTGYMHKAQYEMEERRAFLFQAPMLLIKDTIVVSIQIWLSLQSPPTVALVYSIFSGIVTGLLDMWKLYSALKFWNQAMKMLNDRKQKLERPTSSGNLHRMGTMIGNTTFEQLVLNKELEKMRANKMSCQCMRRKSPHLKTPAQAREPLLHTS